MKRDTEGKVEPVSQQRAIDSSLRIHRMPALTVTSRVPSDNTTANRAQKLAQRVSSFRSVEEKM